MREVRNEKQNRNDDDYVVFWVWTEMKARKRGGMELYKGVCGSLRHPGAQGIGLRVRIYDKWNRMITIEELEVRSNCSFLA